MESTKIIPFNRNHNDDYACFFANAIYSNPEEVEDTKPFLDSEDTKPFLDPEDIKPFSGLRYIKPFLDSEDTKPFLDSENIKSFPTWIDDQKKIFIDIPNNLKKMSRVIYAFFNETKDFWLIGKTESTISKRMSQYKSEIKKAALKKTKKKTETTTGRDLFKRDFLNGDKFVVKILEIVPESASINDCETKWIGEIKKIAAVYNCNRGGGGSISTKNEMPGEYAIIPSKTSPSKKRPLLVDKKGNIRIQRLSPKKNDPILKKRDQTLNIKGPLSEVLVLKKIDSTLQEFDSVLKENETIKFYQVTEVNSRGEPVKRYVGKTTQERPETRLYQHIQCGSELSESIQQNPTSFNFGEVEVFHPQRLSPESRKNAQIFTNSSDVEKALIRIAQEKGPVFNKNGGGGGGISIRAARPFTNDPINLVSEESKASSIKIPPVSSSKVCKKLF